MSRPRSRLSRPRKAPNTESFSPGGTQSHRRLCSLDSLPEKPKQLETMSRSGESGTPSPLPRPTRSPPITEASDIPRANTYRACRQRRRVSSSGGSRRSGLLQAYAANEGTQDVVYADRGCVNEEGVSLRVQRDPVGISDPWQRFLLMRYSFSN